MRVMSTSLAAQLSSRRLARASSRQASSSRQDAGELISRVSALVSKHDRFARRFRTLCDECEAELQASAPSVDTVPAEGIDAPAAELSPQRDEAAAGPSEQSPLPCESSTPSEVEATNDQLHASSPRSPVKDAVSMAAEGLRAIRDLARPPDEPPPQDVLLSVQASALADQAARSQARPEDASTAGGAVSSSPDPSVVRSEGEVAHESVGQSGDATRTDDPASRAEDGRPKSPAAAAGDGDGGPIPTSAVELPEMLSPSDRHCWSALMPSTFKVRGPDYLRDRVKQPSATLSQMLAFEVFRAKEAVPNVAGRPGAPTATLHRRCERPLKTIFVVVMQIPSGRFVWHFAMYFGVFADIDTAAPAAARCLERFIGGDDAYRNLRFKVMAKVSKGPLPVRLAVPSRPAISGRNVPHHYFTTPRYVEVDMDISQDPVAAPALMSP